MPRDINIYPTAAETRLLEQKALEQGMSVDEFVAWLIRQALTKTDADLKNIVKH